MQACVCLRSGQTLCRALPAHHRRHERHQRRQLAGGKSNRPLPVSRVRGRSHSALHQCRVVGKPVTIWGDGSIVRDYLYIDDVADAFLRAAIAPRIPSGEYNVGSGVGTSLQELLEVVFSVAGRRTKVEYLAPRAFDVPAVALDSSKLSNAVGWQPTLDVESIVKRMWNYATTS